MTGFNVEDTGLAALRLLYLLVANSDEVMMTTAAIQTPVMVFLYYKLEEVFFKIYCEFEQKIRLSC